MIRPITNYLCKNLVNYKNCGLVEHKVNCPYSIPEVKSDGSICHRLVFGSHCECPHYKADIGREVVKQYHIVKMELEKLAMIIEENK